MIRKSSAHAIARDPEYSDEDQSNPTVLRTLKYDGMAARPSIARNDESVSDKVSSHYTTLLVAALEAVL